MKITVKYFGELAEICQMQGETLDVAEQMDVNDLLDRLSSKHDIDPDQFRVSLNRKLVEDTSTPLSDLDEVAFLPPFAGG